MQNGEIPLSAVTASTEYNYNYVANNGRLWHNPFANTYRSWMSNPFDKNQYLQISFKNWTKVTGIATQGRGDAGHWVTRYSLLFSYDGVFFRPYKNNQVSKTILILHLL